MLGTCTVRLGWLVYESSAKFTEGEKKMNNHTVAAAAK
jgi:hypothetical protein